MTAAIGSGSLPGARNPEPKGLNNTNRMQFAVYGNAKEQQAVLIAKLDKGASGQAVQKLNLMLGLPEAAGLN